jgi:hypothetical protein
MSDTTKPHETFKLGQMTVTVSQDGETRHIRASKGGEPLTHDDLIQLQILEYVATNTAEKVVNRWEKGDRAETVRT